MRRARARIVQNAECKTRGVDSSPCRNPTLVDDGHVAGRLRVGPIAPGCVRGSAPEHGDARGADDPPDPVPPPSVGTRRRGVAAAFRMVVLAALALAPAVVVSVLGFERRWMDEDAFINLRIVRNLLQGHGPVFNFDERVEAVTSPLWVLILVVFGKLNIGLERVAVGGGIALTVVGILFAQDGAYRSMGRGPQRVWVRWTRPTIPLGAAIVAALPPIWDYASSGLETGLGLAWLGIAYDVSARRVLAAPRRTVPVEKGLTAALLGGGSLIRPEFALYSLAFVMSLAVAVVSASEGRIQGRRVASALAQVAIGAGFLPCTMQLLRMGYFASAVPNTAIAKEAFASNWTQGLCYFDNFFGTYKLAWPLIGAAVFWVATLYGHAVKQRWAALLLTATLVLAAIAHVVYLVRMGGDYMHGRLLVSPLFAALLPVMGVPVRVPGRPVATAFAAATAVAVTTWVGVCGWVLRVGPENVCNIGDERAWYSRIAAVQNPVDLEDFRKHFFYASGQQWLGRIESSCPSIGRAQGNAGGPGCRVVYLEDNSPRIVPAPPASALSDEVKKGVGAVVTVGAIGVVGDILPSDVHVLDFNGLSDPVVARFELSSRGRPGHEKEATDAWILGRFAAPAAGEDQAVTAARHALHCGDLASMIRAITAPLTLRVFFENVRHAWSYSHLHVPRDAFEAEQRFCRLTPLPEQVRGGSGGSAFRWLCPSGDALFGLRGAYSVSDHAVGRLQALCGDRQAVEADDSLVIGPVFGENSEETFEVACPPGSWATGVHGTADERVRSVGLVCRRGAAELATPTGGIDQGQAFSLVCPGQRAAVGFLGRSGALIDAVGISCGRTMP